MNNFGDGFDAGSGAGDDQWHNPANWNNGVPNAVVNPVFAFVNVSAAHDTNPPKQGGPATVSVPGQSAAELYIGQGAGDGEVLVTTGGELAINTHIHIARDSGRNGLFMMDGGLTTVGQHFFVGHQGTTATAQISGGVLNIVGDIRLSDTDATSSATSSVEITGGNVNAKLIGIGARTGGPGTGALTIGGDAVVTTTENVFMRPGAGNSVSVNGSQATINILRGPGTTGFEVHTDTQTNFTFDSGGISSIDIPAANMRFSGLGTLNVDASAYPGNGTFDLFTFGSYHPTGILEFAAENLIFAPGRTGSVLYNPNSIQLQIVPEPATLGLLLLAAGTALLIRRRGGFHAV